MGSVRTLTDRGSRRGGELSYATRLACTKSVVQRLPASLAVVAGSLVHDGTVGCVDVVRPFWTLHEIRLAAGDDT